MSPIRSASGFCALLVALFSTPAHSAPPFDPLALELSFVGTSYDFDSPDTDPRLASGTNENDIDHFLGAGVGVHLSLADTVYFRGRAERLPDFDAPGDIDGTFDRGSVTIGFSDPLTASVRAILELEGRYNRLSGSSLNDSYAEGGVHIGILGTGHGWRTTFAVLGRAPDESDLDAQFGARLELARYTSDNRYGAFFDGELLNDEGTARLGVRRAFH